MLSFNKLISTLLLTLVVLTSSCNRIQGETRNHSVGNGKMAIKHKMWKNLKKGCANVWYRLFGKNSKIETEEIITETFSSINTNTNALSNKKETVTSDIEYSRGYDARTRDIEEVPLLDDYCPNNHLFLLEKASFPQSKDSDLEDSLKDTLILENNSKSVMESGEIDESKTVSVRKEPLSKNKSTSLISSNSLKYILLYDSIIFGGGRDLEFLLKGSQCTFDTPPSTTNSSSLSLSSENTLLSESNINDSLKSFTYKGSSNGWLLD